MTRLQTVRRFFLLALLLLLGTTLMTLSPSFASVGPKDWAAFLRKQDPVWQRLPQNWEEAPFAGNGTQGLMIYQTGPHTLRVLLGDSTVQDHRPGTASFERARLEVGSFDISTAGDLQSCNLRIDLWNAEIRGTVQTSKGTLDIRALVLTQPKVLWVQTKPTGDETGSTLKFVPGNPDSPRTNPHYKRPVPKDYTSNPAPHFDTQNGINVCVQPLANAQTATAWKEQAQDGTRTLFCSIQHSYPGTGAEKAAVDTVHKSFAADPAALLSAHRAWWHAYYPVSFVTLPDAYWESFYWIQMYKMGSASRADGPMVDNHGPWLAPTAWPYATWNMNVPLTYWPMATSNHVDIGYSLSGALTRHLDALINNVPAEYRADSAAMPRATTQDLVGDVSAPPKLEELDNLTWACDDVWMLYRATMNDQFLRTDLYPVLRRSVNYTMHFLTKGQDGKLHLPPTISPEYGPAPDANYNLSLLRWGCHVLLASSARLKIDDPLRPRWREVLADLTPYPQDENGLTIGAGVPLAHPHRHFSHLLMIYPLHLLDPNNPSERTLIQTSLDWWMKTPQGQGFQFDGGAAMAAMLGEGDQALAYLNQLHSRHLIHAATMYSEGAPVIETPLAAAQCLNEMMLQSAGVWKSEAMPTPVIRIFPAMPTAWPDATFQDLRAQGAFLVSAVRANGQTQWVRVKSLAGERAFLRPHMQNPQIKGAGLKRVEAGLYEINLKRGQSVELLAGGRKAAPAIVPIANTEANPFGLKAIPTTL